MGAAAVTIAGLTLCLVGHLCLAMPMMDGWEEPKELAPYKLISHNGTYEVREYEAAEWACTQQNGTNISKRNKMSMFMRMFLYTNGDNSIGKEMVMTAPSTIYKEESPEGTVNKMVMCSYIPKEHQTRPPTPTDAKVFIKRWPTMTVAVRSFKGSYMMPKDQWMMEKNSLKADLRNAGVTNVNFTNYYAAMCYNSHKDGEYMTEEHMSEEGKVEEHKEGKMNAKDWYKEQTHEIWFKLQQ